MHICIVTPNLAPGGAERLVCEEITHFSKFGADVSVVTSFVDEGYLREMGVPEDVNFSTFNEERADLGFIDRFRRIRRHIRSISPDIVCSHYRDEEVYLVRKTTNTSFKFTSQINGTAFWLSDNDRVLPHRRKSYYNDIMDAVPGHREFQADLNVSIKKRLKVEIGEFLRTQALQSAEEVFVLSERIQKEVKSMYGVESSIIRAGVPKDWLLSNKTIRSISPSEQTILSVSRLDERKRISLLISAFASLDHLHENTSLIIGGTGEEEQKLKRQVKDLGVDKFVKFEGYISEGSLLDYYRSADVFACPGYMSYGLAPLEAYSIGTKVGISVDTYVREILEDHPGVKVTKPTPENWAETIDTLLNRPNIDPNTDIIPTWESFSSQKYDALKIT